MLIASKYEEIWAPELNDFVYISDRAYKKEQILTMEKVMLNALKFNLTGAPLSTLFTSRVSAPYLPNLRACRWVAIALQLQPCKQSSSYM